MDKTREKRKWRLSLFLTGADETAGTRRFLAQRDQASKTRADRKAVQDTLPRSAHSAARDETLRPENPLAEKEVLELERDLLEGELEILLETEPALLEDALGEMELETAVLEVEVIDLGDATAELAEASSKQPEDGTPPKRRRRRRRGRGRKNGGQPDAGASSPQ